MKPTNKVNQPLKKQLRTKPTKALGFKGSSYRLLFLLFFPLWVFADIVKPALVEISVHVDGHYQIEIRASIEALLTGINSQYKNTTDSPNAKEYDELREMSASDLGRAFLPFYPSFIQSVQLKLDDKLVPIKISKVSIPEPGYTKVPRISLIVLTGNINRSVQTISWFYPSQYADNAVRVRQVDDIQEKWHWSNWQWLRDDQWSNPFSLTEVFHKPSISSTIFTYAKVGFRHILPKGADHILFILGIFLMSIKIRPLLLQITMFTIAHSITLTMAMLEVFSLPANLVEPLIALSIAYIGIENIASAKIKTSRLIVVFAFGLLHGMGFASMLNDFGMPSGAFTSALIGFNIGVELGQLTVVVLAYVCVAHWFKNKNWYRNVIVIPSSLIISIIGLVWTYQRIDF